MTDEDSDEMAPRPSRPGFYTAAQRKKVPIKLKKASGRKKAQKEQSTKPPLESPGVLRVYEKKQFKDGPYELPFHERLYRWAKRHPREAAFYIATALTLAAGSIAYAVTRDPPEAPGIESQTAPLQEESGLVRLTLDASLSREGCDRSHEYRMPNHALISGSVEGVAPRSRPSRSITIDGCVYR